MFAEICRRNLQKLVEAYHQETGRGKTAMSLSFYGDATFFRQFRGRERSISIDRYNKMLLDFAEAWPEGAKWPDLQPIHFSKENARQQNYTLNRAIKVPHARKRK